MKVPTQGFPIAKLLPFASALLAAAVFAISAAAAPSRAMPAAQVAAPADAPVFTSPAIARNWGDAQEKAGHYQLASNAFFQEAALRDKLGDTEGGEVERRRAWSDETEITVGIPQAYTPDPNDTPAKLEPAAGCLIGTLDTPSVGHTFEGESVADNFAMRIGRPVAVAFRYIRYGQQFPFAWAYAQAKKGRAIELAMEPYDIYAVADDAYLEGFAADLNQSGVDCFLRFGGEMNGSWAPWGKDPDAYKRAFRVVHDVMAHFAPRCAMVWAPNMMPLDNIDKYYPGDDVVDWVGLSLYMVKYFDDNKAEPAWQISPETYIDPFYKKYCAKKPMCLVECGVSREAHADGGVVSDAFAAARIEDLFSAIKLRYPRIKMFCWFDRNNLNGIDVDRRLNDFSLPPGSGALAAFKTAVADPYFLSAMPASADPLTVYRTVDAVPSDYAGPVALSVITYSLNPTIEVTRDAQSESISRPFAFEMPSGTGPVTIVVKDNDGRVSRSLTLPDTGATRLAAN